ncbi:hypothetical protein AB4Z25_25025 [Rhizobium sp. RAF36]|uniref:hypothetical protein n=1 Tax=Rhizobium sp. RAF36 TaxID=3233055 RepID=UPI003F9858BC
MAIVEVTLKQRATVPRCQRMLFAGFEDKTDAEFFLSVDQDLIVHENNPGSQLFEWKDDDAGIACPMLLSASVNGDSSEFPQRWPQQ